MWGGGSRTRGKTHLSSVSAAGHRLGVVFRTRESSVLSVKLFWMINKAASCVNPGQLSPYRQAQTGTDRHCRRIIKKQDLMNFLVMRVVQ